MSKNLIEGASPAEELLLSFKKSPQEEHSAEEEPTRKKPSRKKRTTGAKAADFTEGKKNYRINLALTASLGEALKAEAKKQNRSVNNLAEIIISEYLSRQ